MTPSPRSVFVELDGPDQAYARSLSIDGNSAPNTCGGTGSIRTSNPKTFETHRQPQSFISAACQQQSKKGIQSP
jgi:hypothetical protein